MEQNDNTKSSSSSSYLEKKAKIIDSVLSSPDGVVDLWKLRELALTEGGLVNDEFRTKAWPKLVGLSIVELGEEERDDDDDDDVVVVHKDNDGKIKMSTEPVPLPTDEKDSKLTSPGFNTEDAVNNTDDGGNDHTDNNGVSKVSADDESGNKGDNESNDDGVKFPASSTSNENDSDHVNDDGLPMSSTNEIDDDLPIVSTTSSTNGNESNDENDGSPNNNENCSSTNGNDDDSSSTSSSSCSSSSSHSLKCLDWEQIDRDVVRCTWHLLNGPSQRAIRRKTMSDRKKRCSTLLKQKQRQLGRLINRVFLKSYKEVQVVMTPNRARSRRRGSIGAEKKEEEEEQVLRYYQGYHDVASVFLCALGGGSEGKKVSSATDNLNLPISVLLRVSNSHFRDAMRSGFHHLCTALRLIILPLIGALDPQVHTKLRDTQMEPFFAISWIITWFSHDVRDTETVKRLFDMFIVSHPLMPIYMSIAMVLHPVNRMEILETEVDFAAMHNTLANLPKNSCTVGWRVLAEGGYVSGDDDDFLPVDDSVREDDISSLKKNENTSRNGLDSGQKSIKVPFQDLIDMSISYMRRIPPRNLIRLARRYYSDTSSEHLLSESSSIALLQPPPSWGLASEISTDEWILRQRQQEQQEGLLSSSSSKLKQNNIGGGHGGSLNSEANNKGDDARKRAFDAIVASGMGPDGEEEDRLKIRRKLMLRRGVAVAMISITWALVRSQILPVPGFGGWWLGSLGSSSGTKTTLLMESDAVKDATKTHLVQPVETDQCASNEVCSSKERPAKVEGLLIGSHIAAAFPADDRKQDTQRIRGGSKEKAGAVRWIQRAFKSARVVLSDDADFVTM